MKIQEQKIDHKRMEFLKNYYPQRYQEELASQELIADMLAEEERQ